MQARSDPRLATRNNRISAQKLLVWMIPLTQANQVAPERMTYRVIPDRSQFPANQVRGPSRVRPRPDITDIITQAESITMLPRLEPSFKLRSTSRMTQQFLATTTTSSCRSGTIITPMTRLVSRTSTATGDLPTQRLQTARPPTISRKTPIPFSPTLSTLSCCTITPTGLWSMLPI